MPLFQETNRAHAAPPPRTIWVCGRGRTATASCHVVLFIPAPETFPRGVLAPGGRPRHGALGAREACAKEGIFDAVPLPVALEQQPPRAEGLREVDVVESSHAQLPRVCLLYTSPSPRD